MLTINVQRIANTAVLRCTGRMVVGQGLDTLRDAVLCEMDKGSIVLDLAGVERIDAGGLGMLVFLHTCVNGLGSELKLIAPSPAVAEVLALTRLDSVLTLCPAETGTEFDPRTTAERWEACA
ncbi:MAG TPA: STAS domain-containing protein [Terriglobales bacterium]|nr:STAS domain-containing protein [Terriglobales bacterium]